MQKRTSVEVRLYEFGAGLGIEHHHTSLIYMIKNCLWYFLPTCFYQQIIAYVNLNQ